MWITDEFPWRGLVCGTFSWSIFPILMPELLQVMGQDGNIVQFKIKKHTALKKLMATYCERAGLALQTIRFSFDGTRINESDTPKVN